MKIKFLSVLKAVQRGRIPASQHGILGAHHSLTAAAQLALASITGSNGVGLTGMPPHISGHSLNPLNLPGIPSYHMLPANRNSPHNNAMTAALNSQAYLTFMNLLLRGDSYSSNSQLLGFNGACPPPLPSVPSQATLPPNSNHNVLTCSVPTNSGVSTSLRHSAFSSPIGGSFNWSHLSSLQTSTMAATAASPNTSSIGPAQSPMSALTATAATVPCSISSAVQPVNNSLTQSIISLAASSGITNTPNELATSVLASPPLTEE